MSAGAGRVTGRVTLLGGGGRGIGAATARLLAERGQQVAVLDAFGLEDDLYPLASEADRVALQRIPGVTTHAVDLRDADETAGAVAEVVDSHGHVDAVVALAGAVAGGARVWETEPTLLAALLRANTLTAWNLAAAAVPHLLERPAQARPTYVGVGSVAGSQGLFGLGAYVVAKHAVVGLVRALAADLVGTSVTACGVAPGSTDTPMLRRTAGLYGLDDVAELAQDMQGRKPLPADDLAEVIAFATQAGRALHGAVLRADGGFGHG